MKLYDVKDKKNNLIMKNKYMLARTATMFDYEGLPDTIKETDLELLIQQNGYVFITEWENELLAFIGTINDEREKIMINDVKLKINKEFAFDDGVFINNDVLRLGLLPLFTYYNSMLVENDISMYMNNINTRIQTLLSASDSNTIASAEQFLQKIENGDLGVIAENALFEGMKVNAVNLEKQATTSLIEHNQYLKASLYNEIGLDANYNMKRERLSQSEAEMNKDNLYPLVDNMLLERKNGVNELNEKYDLDVTVEFGSIWAKKELEKMLGTGEIASRGTLEKPLEEPLEKPLEEPIEELEIIEELEEQIDDVEKDVEELEEDIEELEEDIEELEEDIEELEEEIEEIEEGERNNA